MNRAFKLKDFDGPLDLLLTLIGKAQIDIKDIFVSEITDQYLEIVRSAPDLDMDEASDFLVMAATLIEIKSRAMLPKPPKTEEETDPETELIRRLEEYKRFRETAESMKEFEEAAKRVFTKLPEEYPLPPQEVELTGLTLQGLQEAFLRIWQRRPQLDDDPESNHYAPRNIHRDSHTVQECMLNLIYKIRKKKRMRFEEAFSDAPTREEVVTYFLAVLELLKLERPAEKEENSRSGRNDRERSRGVLSEQVGNLKGRIEAILFVAGEAVSIKELARALQTEEKTVRSELNAIRDEYDYNQRGFLLKRFGDKVQLATRPLYSQDVLRLLQPVQQQSLSQAAMETLAVVAYKQPVTRAEVEQVRGVKCDYSLQSLMNKGLIREMGRKDTIGRPILFGTTDEFLSHFGLEGLEYLPPLPENPEAGEAKTEEQIEMGELIP